MVDSDEGNFSAKEFSGAFPLRPVRVCFLFLNPWYISSVTGIGQSVINSLFKSRLYSIKNISAYKPGNIDLPAIQTPVNDTYKTINQVKQ